MTHSWGFPLVRLEEQCGAASVANPHDLVECPSRDPMLTMSFASPSANGAAKPQTHAGCHIASFPLVGDPCRSDPAPTPTHPLPQKPSSLRPAAQPLAHRHHHHFYLWDSYTMTSYYHHFVKCVPPLRVEGVQAGHNE